MKKHTIVDDLDGLTELKIRESKPPVRTNADIVLELSPSILALIAGLRTARKPRLFVERLGIALLALGLQKGTAHLLKQTTHDVRPDPFAKRNSFPSNHTATAFMGAALFQEQLKENKKAFASIGYLLAVSTGLLRLYQNKHWLSDVVVGAAIGFVSVQVARRLVQIIKRHLRDSQPLLASSLHAETLTILSL